MSGDPEIPPVVSVVGRKNSGKTTLVVAVAAELKRRGLRVATVKHGHHDFRFDTPGTDSYRHFHEGEAEAVAMVGGDRVALVMRFPGEPDPQEVVRRFYAGRGYDVVLVEGYKHGPFAKVEVFRRALHDRPILDPTDADAAARFLAVVTDDAALDVPCPVILLDADGGTHVAAVADLLARFARGGGDAA